MPGMIPRSAVSVLAIFIAASALGLGCDDCPTTRQVKIDRKVTGQLSYQGAGAASMAGDLAPFSGFDVSPPSATYTGSFRFTFVIAEPSRANNAFSARFVVPLVPPGASAIELSDDVATLTIHTVESDTVYHGLTGHLQWVDSTCQTNCPLELQGTVTVSATGPDGETFEVTSGAFVAADTFYYAHICQG